MDKKLWVFVCGVGGDCWGSVVGWSGLSSEGASVEDKHKWAPAGVKSKRRATLNDVVNICELTARLCVLLMPRRKWTLADVWEAAPQEIDAFSGTYEHSCHRRTRPRPRQWPSLHNCLWALTPSPADSFNFPPQTPNVLLNTPHSFSGTGLNEWKKVVVFFSF